MVTPLLSIIIPAYNSDSTLLATLNSIGSQTFKNLECWVIDGGSTDNTLEIVERFSKTYPFVQYVSGPDKGIYDAMNKGIQLAKGDHLYFMGSDDVFSDRLVLQDISSLLLSQKHDFVYGDIIFKHSGIRQGEEKNYLKLIKNLENINHQSIFYSKKVFALLGCYDLRFPIYADFHFNIKCFKESSISKQYINRSICIFNEKGASFSQRNRDNYIEKVHENYVQYHEDPVALYDTVRLVEAELARLLNSKDYRYGKKIGNSIRWMRKVTRLQRTQKG